MASLQKVLLHLQSNHQLSIEEKEIKFDTLEEFYEWKENFEKTTHYGKGIPVAWMLSNREEGISLIAFFAAIKGSSGVISSL